MTLSSSVANTKRWIVHMDTHKDEFTTTCAITKDLLDDLRYNGHITDDHHIDLTARPYGSKLYEVLRTLQPTRDQVDDLANIFAEHGCRLLEPVMTQFNASQDYFDNMSERMIEISRLVQNVDKVISALEMPYGEKSRIIKHPKDEEKKKEIVKLLALKEVHSLPEILELLKGAGEWALCDAILECCQENHAKGRKGPQVLEELSTAMPSGREDITSVDSSKSPAEPMRLPMAACDFRATSAPSTLQVSTQGTLVNLENLPVSGTPASINITNVNIVNNTTTNTNVVSVNNNVQYFQNHAEMYKFLNFALPTEGAEECQWTSPKNITDGPCFGKPTKKFHPNGKGLALLLNWHFSTVLNELPAEVIGNKEMSKLYLGLERQGAEQDTKYVCSKFAELTGNKVLEKHNIATVKQLHGTMEAFRNHALSMTPPPAYLTVIVSTHGLNGYKLILDHLGLADLFKDIVYQLSHEAPGFKDSSHFGHDMPRLFFVQACQQDVPAEVAAGIKNEFPSVLNSASNFLVALATIPSNVAYRHEIKGSYYIKAIFECFAKGRSLHEMLKEVDETVRSSFDQKTSAYVSLDFPLTEFAF